MNLTLRIAEITHGSGLSPQRRRVRPDHAAAAAAARGMPKPTPAAARF